MDHVTFKGTKIRITSPQPEIGELAPALRLVNQELNEVSLADFGGKKKLLNVFVSLDTPVCAESIRRFDKDSKQSSDFLVINISMDLPFAASRFCTAGKAPHLITLSAFRSSFPKDYGVLIEEGPLKGLCARALFLLAEDDRIIYREIVPEITKEPNYEACMERLKTS